MSHIEIRSVKPERAQEILKFFQDDFAKREPLMSSLGGLVSKAFDLWVIRLVEEGFSFEAIDTSDGDKLVGAFLCSVYANGVKNSIDKELESVDIDYELGAVMDILHEPMPIILGYIYGEKQKKNYVDGLFLGVSPNYGGNGIGTRLLEAVENKAREMGVGAVLISATSSYTGQIVAKRGYKQVHQVVYSEYLKDGKVVFPCQEPHLDVKFCVKILEN